MNKISFIVVTIVMTLCIATTSNAKNAWKNQGKEYQSHTQDKLKYDARIEFRFSNYDRKKLYQYYNYGKGKNRPPGLAKKKQLPPGLQKQLLRNGKLPPGLQGRYLPYELERQLDRLPGNFVRIRIGTDIVLMDSTTKIVLDVIKDIVF